MKKLFPVLLLVLVLLTATFSVAFAESASYRPSAGFKDVEMSGAKVDEETGESYYEIIDSTKTGEEAITRVPIYDISITAFSEKEKEDSKISEQEKQDLEEAYEAIVRAKSISELAQNIDFEAIAKEESADYTAANLVVSDLFSVEVTEDYKLKLYQDNTSITVILHIQGADKVISVLHKVAATGNWEKANMKGQKYNEETGCTDVTVEFDSLCPVAVIKANKTVEPVPEPEPEKPEPQVKDPLLDTVFKDNVKYLMLFYILACIWAVEMIIIASILAVKLKKSKQVKTRSVVPVALLALFAGIPLVGKIVICVLAALIAVNLIIIICLLIPDKKEAAEEVPAKEETPASEEPAVTVEEEPVEEVPVATEVAAAAEVEEEKEDNPLIDIQAVIDEDYFIDEVKNKILLVTGEEAISGYADIRSEVEELKKVLAGFEDIDGVEGISKQALCEYFAATDSALDVYHRDNYVNDKLPLADAYYTDVNGAKRNFAFIYENKKGGLIVFLRVSQEQADNISNEHVAVIKSAFPKVTAGDPWFILKIDASYTLKDLVAIIEKAKENQK